MKTVDIIIPCYNSHDTINQALASVAMQKLKPDERIRVTLVDDASTEGDYHSVADFWHSLLDIWIVERPENGGPGLARQDGIDNTNGEYIMFLDSDDTLYSPYAVTHLLTGIEDNAMIMGQFSEEDENGNEILHEENYIWMHGKLIRRSSVEKIGLRFNDSRQNEDVGWNIVFSNMFEEIVYIKKKVYCWNNRKGSLVRTDPVGYKYGYGWRGLIDNIVWAMKELEKRDAKIVNRVELAAHTVAKTYFQFCESIVKKPEDLEQNRTKLREMYKQVIEPLIISGDLKTSDLFNSFVKVNATYELRAIPRITYSEYIGMLEQC